MGERAEDLVADSSVELSESSVETVASSMTGVNKYVNNINSSINEGETTISISEFASTTRTPNNAYYCVKELLSANGVLYDVLKKDLAWLSTVGESIDKMSDELTKRVDAIEDAKETSAPSTAPNNDPTQPPATSGAEAAPAESGEPQNNLSDDAKALLLGQTVLTGAAVGAKLAVTAAVTVGTATTALGLAGVKMGGLIGAAAGPVGIVVGAAIGALVGLIAGLIIAGVAEETPVLYENLNHAADSPILNTIRDDLKKTTEKIDGVGRTGMSAANL